MKLYEGLFLFDANAASRDWPGLERHVEDLFKKHAAELVYSERWPDRKLSYEVRGCRKGTYFLTYFNCPPGHIQALTRDCELSERVLRQLFLQNEHIEAELERRRSPAKADEGAGDGARAAADRDAQAAARRAEAPTESRPAASSSESAPAVADDSAAEPATPATPAPPEPAESPAAAPAEASSVDSGAGDGESKTQSE